MATVSDYQFKFIPGGMTTGIVLNGNNNMPTVGNPVWDILSVEGMDMPDIKVSSKDHDQWDGGAVEAGYVSIRTIVIKGNLICHQSDSLEYWLDKLKQNYAPTSWESGFGKFSGGTFYAKAPGVPERYLQAKVTGVKYTWDNTRRFNSQAFMITLQAAIPYWFSTVGKSYSCAAGQKLTYYNEGNVGVGGLIKIISSGGCFNPGVTWIGDNPTFVIGFGITTQLLAGQEVWLDLEQKTVFKMTTATGAFLANLRGQVNDDAWFKLKPGGNRLTPSFTSGSASLSLAVTDVWL